MPLLLDTGIILRLINKIDAEHSVVRSAVRILIKQREELVIAIQNTAEYLNVATRPLVNNGLGLAPKAALDLLERDIEPICAVLSERDNIYDEYKRLIAQYSVIGKQVHDARLVAMMLTWQVGSILTLNERNFRRYEPEGIVVVTPASLAAAGP